MWQNSIYLQNRNDNSILIIKTTCGFSKKPKIKFKYDNSKYSFNSTLAVFTSKVIVSRCYFLFGKTNLIWNIIRKEVPTKLPFNATTNSKIVYCGISDLWQSRQSCTHLCLAVSQAPAAAPSTSDVIPILTSQLRKHTHTQTVSDFKWSIPIERKLWKLCGLARYNVWQV